MIRILINRYFKTVGSGYLGLYIFMCVQEWRGCRTELEIKHCMRLAAAMTILTSWSKDQTRSPWRIFIKTAAALRRNALSFAIIYNMWPTSVTCYIYHKQTAHYLVSLSSLCRFQILAGSGSACHSIGWLHNETRLAPPPFAPWDKDVPFSPKVSASSLRCQLALLPQLSSPPSLPFFQNSV